MALPLRGLTRDMRHETWAKDIRQQDKKEQIYLVVAWPLQVYSYYYRSFSCFFAKNFHLTFSCAKRFFKPPSRRSRWLFQHSDFFYSNKSFSGLTARRWGILFVPCIQWTTKKIRVHLCSFVVPNEYLILNYWQTNLWNWFLRASLEEFDGASRRPPFAAKRDESAMPTAGRHFKIQIRIPSCLFDWIAFACQKRIVLRGDHEQWDF